MYINQRWRSPVEAEEISTGTSLSRVVGAISISLPLVAVLSAVSIVAETLLPVVAGRVMSIGVASQASLPTRPHSIQNGETTAGREGRPNNTGDVKSRMNIRSFPAAAIAAFRCFMRAGLLPGDRHRFRLLPAPVTHIYRFYSGG